MIARLNRARAILTRHRESLARLCALAAVLLMIASAIRFRPGPLVELNQSPAPAAYDFPPGRPRSEVSFAGVPGAARLLLLGGGLLIAALGLAGRTTRSPEYALTPAPSPIESMGEGKRRGACLLRPRSAPPLHLEWRGSRGVRLTNNITTGSIVFGLGAAALFLLAEANGQWIGIRWVAGMSSPAQCALLIGGVMLVVWGLAAVSNLTPGPSPNKLERGSGAAASNPPLHVSWRGVRGEAGTEVALVAAITLLALVLRVWNLNGAIHAFVDELNFATAVRDFWIVRDVKLLTPITEVVAFPRLYPYWESWTVAVWGRNLAGLRMVSAILGTLTIPAMYGLARTLFDKQTAFIAAALLAAFPAHLHYSRLGMNNIADPFFGTLALACLAYARQSNRRGWYALAGAMLGMTQYFYEAGRIIFPALAISWIGIGALIGKHKPRQPHPPSPALPPPGGKGEKRARKPLPSLWGKGLGDGGRLSGLWIAALAALIVAMPVYYTLVGRHLPLAARSHAMIYPASYWRDLLVAPSGSTPFRDHLRHIEETFLIYVHQHEASFFYAGETPFVLIYLVPLLLLGIFVTLWKVRTPGGLLLVLWIAAVSLGNSFVVNNMDSPRYVMVFPALALLCAVGLRYTLALLWPDATRPLLRRIALAGLVIAITAGQGWYYLGPQVDLFNYQYQRAKLDRDFEDALLRSAHFPPGTQIHIIGTAKSDEHYATDLIGYLADNLTVETLARTEITTDYLWNLPRTVDHAFFLEPGDEDTLNLLRLHFRLPPPDYTPYPVAEDKQFVLYYAPASVTSAP